jgi:hypothetical protein
VVTLPLAASVMSLETASLTAGLAARISASRVCDLTQMVKASLSAFSTVSSLLFRSSRNAFRMTL